MRIAKNYSQRSYIYYGDKRECVGLLKQIKAVVDSYPTQSAWIKATRDSFTNDLFDSLQEICVELTSHNGQIALVPKIDLTYLTDYVEKVGFQAKQSGKIICLLIQDIHCLKQIEIDALCMAIHKANQLGLPIILFGSGLPTVIHLLANSRPYAERLFIYCEIG